MLKKSYTDQSVGQVKPLGLLQTIRLSMEQGFQEGFENGFQQGFQQGIKKGKQQLVKNMFEEGLPLGLISKITALSIEELKKILH